jgi:hypothetical protein
VDRLFAFVSYQHLLDAGVLCQKTTGEEY